MSDTVFVNGITLSDSDWFNDVNRLHYTIFGDPADLAAVKVTLHAAPGAIGGTTPAAGSFTALSATGVSSLFGTLMVRGVDGSNRVATFGDGTASQLSDIAYIGASTANFGVKWSFFSGATEIAHIARAGRIDGGTSNDVYFRTTTATALKFGTNGADNLSIASGGAITLSSSLTLDTILSAATTATVFNTVATTVNAFGAASVALNIGNASAAAAFPGGISIPTGKSVTGTGTATVTGFTTISAATGMAVGGATAGTGGVAFPATAVAVADVNTLDDYEEGTWTPTLGGTSTYTIQVGFYTKIGRIVHIQGAITVNSIGSGSATTLSGLPFANGQARTVPISVANTGSLTTAVVSVMATVDGSASTISFYSRTAANAADGLNSVFQDAARVTFSGSYIA